MTTKMRVTFLLADPGNLAGGNRVLAQHAAYLRDAGHAVTLVATPRAARRTSPAPSARKSRLKLAWSRSLSSTARPALKKDTRSRQSFA